MAIGLRRYWDEMGRDLMPQGHMLKVGKTMDRRQFALSFAALASCSTLAPKSKNSSQIAAGRVVQVRGVGSAEILRGSGECLPAISGVLLYGGDQVRAAGDIEVDVSLYGEILTIKATEPIFIVPLRSVGPIDLEDEEYFEHHAGFIAKVPSGLPTYRQTREESKPDFHIQPSLLAPTGTQFLPVGTKTVAFVWRGGRSRVLVNPGVGDPFELDSGGNAWIVLRVPAGTDRFRVQLSHTQIEWQLQIVDKSTLEKWSGGRLLKNSSTGRVRWAHETLVAKPPSYNPVRVAALSIVAEESLRSDINTEFARVTWLASRNGYFEQKLSG